MSEPTAPPPAPDEGVVDNLVGDLRWAYTDAHRTDAGSGWRAVARHVLARERKVLLRVHPTPCALCEELIPMSECDTMRRVTAIDRALGSRGDDGESGQ
jgi:hypothetical protein